MGHTPSYSWTAKMFYWWTVSLCLIEANHVTTAGLCLSLYLATRGKGSLYFLGYCMLVDLFYQLFMKKCERKILTEIKKKTLWKATFRLRHWFFPPCCSAPSNSQRTADTVYHICLYQTSRSHLNLTLMKAPS